MSHKKGRKGHKSRPDEFKTDLPEPQDPELMMPLLGTQRMPLLNTKIHHNDSDNEGIFTLKEIVTAATDPYTQNDDTTDALILSHKMFTKSVTLLKILKKRFFDEVQKNDNDEDIMSVQKMIHLRAVKVFKDWMKLYWDEDFNGNDELKQELDEWLKEMLSYYQQQIQLGNDYKWIPMLHATITITYTRFLEKNEIKDDDEPQMNLSVNEKKILMENYNEEEIANQITLMEFKLFQTIKPRDLLYTSLEHQKIQSLMQINKRFNDVTILIQQRILSQRKLKHRTNEIKRWIRIGEQFRETLNYQSLGAVYNALYSAPIQRLELAWNGVNDAFMKKCEEWKLIFTTDQKYRNMRALMRKTNGKPCIPFLMMYLKDIKFINDKLSIGSSMNAGINFSIYMKLSERIQLIKRYQMEMKGYQNIMKEKRELQQELLYEMNVVENISEDDISEKSTVIKSSDEKEAAHNL